MPRWILGLGGSDHDFSAALMCDGDIRVAIEQERLSRRKYGRTLWFESPVQKAIDYCLAAEGISMDDVSAILSGDTLPARASRTTVPRSPSVSTPSLSRGFGLHDAAARRKGRRPRLRRVRIGERTGRRRASLQARDILLFCVSSRGP